MDTREWTDKQFELAQEIVADVENVQTAIVEVGSERDSASWGSALERLEDTAQMQIGKGLTALQHQVAVIHGRGVEFSTIAQRLGVNNSDLHEWFQSIPVFRAAIDYYRTMQMEEIGGKVRSTVDRMLGDESLSPKELAAILRVGEKIGATPAERKDKEIDFRVRMETAEMTAGALSGKGGSRGLSRVRVVSVEEGEFEVVSEPGVTDDESEAE